MIFFIVQHWSVCKTKSGADSWSKRTQKHMHSWDKNRESEAREINFGWFFLQFAFLNLFLDWNFSFGSGKLLVDILPLEDITQLVRFYFQGSFFECRSLEATVADKSEVWGEVDGFLLLLARYQWIWWIWYYYSLSSNGRPLPLIRWCDGMLSVEQSRRMDWARGNEKMEILLK